MTAKSNLLGGVCMLGLKERSAQRALIVYLHSLSPTKSSLLLQIANLSIVLNVCGSTGALAAALPLPLTASPSV
jgi:hypothetical protein